MSLTVCEIMNPQLLYVSEGDAAEVVCAKLLRFSVTGASFRVSRPVVTANDDTPVDDGD